MSEASVYLSTAERHLREIVTRVEVLQEAIAAFREDDTRLIDTESAYQISQHAMHVAVDLELGWTAAQVERAKSANQAAVDRVRAGAERMAAESPKPGPGGFLAEEVLSWLDGPEGN